MRKVRDSNPRYPKGVYLLDYLELIENFFCDALFYVQNMYRIMVLGVIVCTEPDGSAWR